MDAKVCSVLIAIGARFVQYRREYSRIGYVACRRWSCYIRLSQESSQRICKTLCKHLCYRWCRFALPRAFALQKYARLSCMHALAASGHYCYTAAKPLSVRRVASSRWRAVIVRWYMNRIDPCLCHRQNIKVALVRDVPEIRGWASDFKSFNLYGIHFSLGRHLALKLLSLVRWQRRSGRRWWLSYSVAGGRNLWLSFIFLI